MKCFVLKTFDFEDDVSRRHFCTFGRRRMRMCKSVAETKWKGDLYRHKINSLSLLLGENPDAVNMALTKHVDYKLINFRQCLLQDHTIS